MLEIDPLEDDTGGTVFRDVIMLVLAGFVVTVLLLLPHINPPAQAAKESMDPLGMSWSKSVDRINSIPMLTFGFGRRVTGRSAIQIKAAVFSISYVTIADICAMPAI